jgi:hypothetical protein
MKRVWGNILAAASLLAGSAVVFSACVHDDSTIFVRDVMAPPTTGSTGGGCLYTADPTQPALSSGVLDVAVRGEYEAVFLVGNQMVPEVNQNQLQTETSTVTIQGSVVRITDAKGQQLTTYTRLATATIGPSSGSTPGYATVVGVTILDPITVANNTAILPVRLVTYVRFFGVTLGGKSVESNEFEFPIDVCLGCLAEYTNSPLNPLPNCVVGVGLTSTTTTVTTPCNVGEDQGYDCNLGCDAIPACKANSM